MHEVDSDDFETDADVGDDVDAVTKFVQASFVTCCTNRIIN